MKTKKVTCMAALLVASSLILTACGGGGGGTATKTWYQDVDGDGYSDGVIELATSQPDGFVEAASLVSTEVFDCDDGDASIYPGATEILSDTIDQDCDGVDLSGTIYFIDADDDTFGDAAVSLEALTQPDGYVDDDTDCDDDDASIYPGATEILSDTIDQDCDGADLSGTIYFIDADGDTFGDSTVSLEALTQPGGYVDDDTDCNDDNDNAYPGNFESCSDAVDNDCDGFIDESACASDTTATLMGNCYYTDGETPEPDVLISGLLGITDVYSEYSDTTGSYVIYNIAPGVITVSAWKSGLNFDNSAGLLGVTLVADSIEYLDFYAVSDAVGSITGATVSYLQGGSVAVDVTLHDPVTGAPVSGLSTVSYDAGALVWSYDLAEIPDGDFEIRAAAGEDGFVMLVGQPVTFADGTLTAGTADISVVKAVGIDVPTPGGGEVLSAQPTFSGPKHTSANKGHAIELLDAAGVLVWGGFVQATGEAVVLLGAADWSVVYAGPTLVSGEIYQLRVYGLRNGMTDADIISFSEEHDGFFIVE